MAAWTVFFFGFLGGPSCTTSGLSNKWNGTECFYFVQYSANSVKLCRTMSPGRCSEALALVEADQTRAGINCFSADLISLGLFCMVPRVLLLGTGFVTTEAFFHVRDDVPQILGNYHKEDGSVVYQRTTL